MSESKGQRRHMEQPPLSDADRESLEAALVPSTTAGMPPTAQTFFAVVESDGTLTRGFGAVSATSLGLGRYQVVFGHDVTGSAYVATQGLSGSSGIAPPGMITVVGRAGLPAGVFVATYDEDGDFADRAFHIAVLS